MFKYSDLENYLQESGQNDEMSHEEIFLAIANPIALLEKLNNQEKRKKITFNRTYHPVFQDIRKILEETHLILASDDGNKKIFLDAPMIGFKINKMLKEQLEKGELKNVNELGSCQPCGVKRLVIYVKI